MGIVSAFVYFATERHKSIFSNDEAADIKSVMQSYGDTPSSGKRLVHGSVTMRNTCSPLMK